MKIPKLTAAPGNQTRDLKAGPSDIGTKILQKILKNHPYTPKAF